MAEFGFERARIRPTTSLHSLFSASNRAAMWPRLTAALGLADLPELPRQRTPTAKAYWYTLAAVSLAWWLILPLLALFSGEDFTILYGLVIHSLLALLVSEFFGLFWLTYKFDYLQRVRVPEVRHLVIRLLLQDDSFAAGETSPRTIWAELAKIVAKEACVPASDIRPEQSISELPDYC